MLKDSYGRNGNQILIMPYHKALTCIFQLRDFCMLFCGTSAVVLCINGSHEPQANVDLDDCGYHLLCLSIGQNLARSGVSHRKMSYFSYFQEYP